MQVRSIAKDILGGLAVAAILLVAIEVVARVATTIRQDIAAVGRARPVSENQPWATYSPSVGWTLRPNFNGNIEGSYRHLDENGFSSVDAHQIQDWTQYRILFVGDSNTFGYGNSAEASFPEVVDELLDDAVTINVGVPGYSSYQGRVTLEHFLPIVRPDMIVVSFNFNDRRYVADPTMIDSADHFRNMYEAAVRPTRDLTHPLETFHTFLALRFAMRRLGLARSPTDDPMSLESTLPRVDENGYRTNLREMAALAQRAGIPIIFLALKDNPVESLHVRQGIVHFRNGEYAKAIRHLLVSRASSGTTSTTHFIPLASLYLADAYRATGEDSESIREVLTIRPSSAIRDGGGVIRLDTDYNDIMREVAAETGATLVDATRLQDTHWHTFIDSCHFDAEGHRLVAELLVDGISASRLAQAADVDAP